MALERASKRVLRRRTRLGSGFAVLFLAYPLSWAIERLFFREGDPATSVVIAGFSVLTAVLLLALLVLPYWMELRRRGGFPDLRVAPFLRSEMKSDAGPYITVILLDIFNDNERAVSLECALEIPLEDGPHLLHRGLAEDLAPDGPRAHFAGQQGWLPIPINIDPGHRQMGAIGFIGARVDKTHGTPTLILGDSQSRRERRFKL